MHFHGEFSYSWAILCMNIELLRPLVWLEDRQNILPAKQNQMVKESRKVIAQ